MSACRSARRTTWAPTPSFAPTATWRFPRRPGRAPEGPPPRVTFARVGSVGAPELIVIFLVALIVLGPDKLPGAARQAGKMVGDLRRMMAGFEAEVRSAIADDPIHNALQDA